MDGSIVVHPVNSDRFSIRTDLSGSKASERMLARDPKKNGPNARRVKRKEKKKKKKRQKGTRSFIIGWSGSRRVPKGGLGA